MKACLRFLGLCSCSLSVACAATGEDKPPVFGGQGARVSENTGAIPLTEADAESALTDTGPCAQPAPKGERLLLDDFEDGDSKIFKVFEREGWWFTATDGTEGEKVSPDSGTFKPVPLPESEATPENEYAAHLSAEGQADWGVVWGTTLKWVRKGIGCPFNASGFAGLEFRAKGPATVWLNFATPTTTPRDNGGKCKEKCWDSYGKLVRIKPGWNHYVVRWEQLQQEGWGTDVHFEADRLMNINFSAKTQHLPVDFWIDDLKFLNKQAPSGASASAE